MNIPDRPEWDDREEPQEPYFQLQVPFTEVVSEGGPYEDTAYVAGFQTGRIDGLLESRRIAATTFLVFSKLAHQIDLIAMRHGYKSDVLTDDREWAQIGVTRLNYSRSN